MLSTTADRDEVFLLIHELAVTLYQALLVVEVGRNRRMVAIRRLVHVLHKVSVLQALCILVQLRLDVPEKLTAAAASSRRRTLLVRSAAVEVSSSALVRVVSVVVVAELLLHGAELVLLLEQDSRVQLAEAPVHHERVVAAQEPAESGVFFWKVFHCPGSICAGDGLQAGRLRLLRATVDSALDGEKFGASGLSHAFTRVQVILSGQQVDPAI